MKITCFEHINTLIFLPRYHPTNTMITDIFIPPGGSLHYVKPTHRLTLPLFESYGSSPTESLLKAATVGGVAVNHRL